jgi:predicted nuclease of predicted toxin-antitoxin system
VRLLIDANLSHRVATALRDAGHDAVHISDRALGAAEDSEIVTLARAEGRVIISCSPGDGHGFDRSRSGGLPHTIRSDSRRG